MAKKHDHTDVHKSINKGDSKLGRQFSVTEKKSNITGESAEWEGAEIETKSDPLIDDGSGKPVILRRFDFSLQPGIIVDKKKLLEFHRTKIIAFLWKDELELIKELKIVFSKDNIRFRIFALCQAKKGSLILKKPLMLQQLNASKTT